MNELDISNLDIYLQFVVALNLNVFLLFKEKQHIYRKTVLRWNLDTNTTE